MNFSDIHKIIEEFTKEHGGQFVYINKEITAQEKGDISEAIKKVLFKKNENPFKHFRAILSGPLHTNTKETNPFLSKNDTE